MTATHRLHDSQLSLLLRIPPEQTVPLAALLPQEASHSDYVTLCDSLQRLQTWGLISAHTDTSQRKHIRRNV